MQEEIKNIIRHDILIKVTNLLWKISYQKILDSDGFSGQFFQI